jgi:KaiC/GvpD/RAD55 family RecA-like ATPase
MFPENYTVLVVGDPSAGMFEFCCYLGATYLKSGERLAFLEANTSPDQVRKQMREFGVDVDFYLREGRLTIIDAYTPANAAFHDAGIVRVENLDNLSDIFEALTKSIENLGEPPVKVLVDSLTPFFMQHDTNAVGRFYKDVCTMAKFSGTMTSVVHQGILDEDQIALLASISDSLLEMKVDDNFRRFVRIKHMRGVLVKPKWVPFDFEREAAEGEGASLVWSRDD